MFRRRKKGEGFSKYAIAADAIAIFHFIVANIALLLGEFTNMFSSFGNKHAGVHFIFNYFCWPVYSVLESYLQGVGKDWASLFFGAQLVIIASSIFYAIILYIIFRIIGFFFSMLVV